MNEKIRPDTALPITNHLEALELKANLTPERKYYLEKLKAKLEKISKGKTAEQMAKAGDLETMEKYNLVLDEILEMLKNPKIDHEVVILETGAVGILEKRVTGIEEIQNLISVFENVAGGQDYIFCLKEVLSADNKLVYGEFEIKDRKDCYFVYRIKSESSEGLKISKTSVDKVDLDENGSPLGGHSICEIKDGKWERSDSI